LPYYFEKQSTFKINNMEPTQTSAPSSNKVLLKAAITGILILVMMVPAYYVNNLVKERETRQQQVVKEVSSKWASAQTVTGPYLVIPYDVQLAGKAATTKNLILLPSDLQVTGTITPEERHRSIYQVLLYRSQLQFSGAFRINLPPGIPAANLKIAEARICIGISDFKGIEDKINLQLNNTAYGLQPGLPTTEIDKAGLSSPVALTAEAIAAPVQFSMPLQLRGSSQLHFAPLAANSSFNIRSSWPNPSFDGSILPTMPATAGEKGFNATWNFSQANLPFPTAITTETIDKEALAFGVSMLQPADQYAKTIRCTKYAILVIGLSFALFFITELMQRQPVHPLQYILVGLALIVFYTLLLSLSEFIDFDLSYLLAASATILLIGLYVKGYFRSWKVAGVFAGILGALYGFIFTIIRLEDTALLVGSIGLFTVLALVMYASRRINWYSYTTAAPAATQDKMSPWG
jgi:inner membrane protein